MTNITTPRITEKEIAIIKRAQSGDIAAFNKLFKKYKGFVDNLLYLYIRDKDEAKDLTNIVFLKVYDKLATFTTYSSFGGWLRVLANRTAIDYLREVNRHKINMDTETDRLSEAESIYSDEDELVTRLTSEVIIKALSKYPKQTQRIFELFYVDNLTVTQISEQLKLPSGTIKSVLSRTRKKLQKQLKNL